MTLQKFATPDKIYNLGSDILNGTTVFLLSALSTCRLVYPRIIDLI